MGEADLTVTQKSALPRREATRGRMTSIATKLAAATTAVIIAVTALVYVRLTRYQRENLLHSKEIAASAVSRLFADWCAAGVVFDDSGTLKEALATLGRNGEVEYAAIWEVSAAGKVGRKLAALERGRSERVPGVALETGLRRDADRVVLTSPVHDQGGKTVGVVVVAFSLARENAAITAVERTTLIISIAVALGLIAVLKVIANIAISTPLNKLVVAARQLEEGGTGEIDVHSRDEVGQLAQAFRSMASAIRVREEHIKSGNRNMRLVLDNVGQGFVTLDAEGRMSTARSRVVDEWFGPVDHGPLFSEYLRGTDPLVADFFEIGWSAIVDDVLPLELCLEQLPGRVHKDDRTFELAYRSILDDNGRLTRLIVVITEVTALILREAAEQAQRDTMAIFRRILSDRFAMDEFFTEADRLVDSITGGPGGGGARTLEDAVLRRELHTLKGNCAVFGLERVARVCHLLEDHLADSTDGLSLDDARALRAEWEKLRQIHAELTGSRSSGAIEVGPGEYHAFLAELRHRLGHDALVATVATWQFEPAVKRLGVIAEQVRGLAGRLGKASVETLCEPTELRLPPRKWRSFWATFAHVMRNAVDHGIETTLERLAAGKPEHATVTLAIYPEGPHVVVSLRDDGRGIDWPKIAQRAREQGLPDASQQDLEEALYVEGISSRDAVSATSGRGVGLGAVREHVRELGGHIEIESTAGAGTTFRCVLPRSMLTEESAPPAPGIELIQVRGAIEVVDPGRDL